MRFSSSFFCSLAACILHVYFGLSIKKKKQMVASIISFSVSFLYSQYIMFATLA